MTPHDDDERNPRVDDSSVAFEDWKDLYYKDDPSVTSGASSDEDGILHKFSGRSLRYGGKLLRAEFPGKQPQFNRDEEDTESEEPCESEDGDALEDTERERCLERYNEDGSINAPSLEKSSSNFETNVAIDCNTEDAEATDLSTERGFRLCNMKDDSSGEEESDEDSDDSSIETASFVLSSVEYYSDEDSSQVSAVSTSDADSYDTDSSSSQYEDEEGGNSAGALTDTCFARKTSTLSQDEMEEPYPVELKMDNSISGENIQEFSQIQCNSASVPKPGDSTYLSGRSSPPLPVDDLVELVSDALEFDFWSHDKLQTAVSILSSRLSPLKVPIQLPCSSDASFWIDEMLLALTSQSACSTYLTSHPSIRAQAAVIVHNAFKTELTCLSLMHIETADPTNSPIHDNQQHNRRLYVGSLSDLESRLALAVLGIKRIIAVAYQPIYELWVSDGVRYTTHIIPVMQGVDGYTSDARIRDVIESAADEVTLSMGVEGALGENSILIACPYGDKYSCTIATLFLARSQHTDVKYAMEVMLQAVPKAHLDVKLLRNFMNNSNIIGSKRVLSCQMLVQLANGSSAASSLSESQKRPRTSPIMNGCIYGASSCPQELPFLFLGPSAVSNGDLIFGPPQDGDSEDEFVQFDDTSSVNTLEEYPEVSLLTPPASPSHIFKCEKNYLSDGTSSSESDGLPRTAPNFSHSSPSSLHAFQEEDDPESDGLPRTAPNFLHSSPSSPHAFQEQDDLFQVKTSCDTPLLSPKASEQTPFSYTGLTPRLQGLQVSFSKNFAA